MAWIKAFKGFDKDMKCRDFQFEEGKVYEEQEAKLCEKGFHACETPVDCLGYYPAGSSVFRAVELDATEETNSEDTKRVGKRIKIGAEINVAGMVKAHFEYRKAHCTNEQNAEPGKPASAGEYGAASAGASGAASAGECGAACSRGSVSVGANGIACARGNHCTARGGLGAVLLIGEEKEDSYDLASWKAVRVDGEKIKADTWYELKDGEFTEVEANENHEA